MNNKLDELLQTLAKEISAAEEVREYWRYKTLISEDSFLVETEKRLKTLQKLMTNNVSQKDIHEQYKNEYETLKKRFDAHPYVINYNNYVCEVSDLLTEIKTIIE